MVLAVQTDGSAKLLVNDSPQTLLLRRRLSEPPFSEQVVGDKKESEFELGRRYPLSFSDGVPHAGGWNFELGWGMGTTLLPGEESKQKLEPEFGPGDFGYCQYPLRR